MMSARSDDQTECSDSVLGLSNVIAKKLNPRSLVLESTKAQFQITPQVKPLQEHPKLLTPP